MTRSEPPDNTVADAAIAAAVVTVLAARALSDPDRHDHPAPEGVWADPAHRPGVPEGPAELGWWASGLPR